MFKILADHCVHTDLVEALRVLNIKVVKALEISLAKASDQEIFNYAKSKGFVLLSFDKEFGTLFYFDRTVNYGVVIIYIERMSRDQIIERTVEFFRKATFKSLRDHLFIIEPTRVRIVERE